MITISRAAPRRKRTFVIMVLLLLWRQQRHDHDFLDGRYGPGWDVDVRPGRQACPMTGRSRDQVVFEQTLRRQRLVVSRAQALGCGMTPAMLRHRLRSGGPWQRMLPGVYLTVTGTPTLLQREHAALLYGGPRSIITSQAALRRHGVRVPEPQEITVLVPVSRPSMRQAFVSVASTTRLPEFYFSDGLIRFTAPERAVADAARAAGSFREVRALVAEVVQKGRCPIKLISEELRQGPVQGSAWLRQVLAEVADGVRSAAEGELRDLIVSAGLPMPLFNASLYKGPVFIARPDAWWPWAGVAVEVDSREWHLSPDASERDSERHSAMTRLGVLLHHVTPGQLRRQPGRVVADIRESLAAGRPQEALGIRTVPASG